MVRKKKVCIITPTHWSHRISGAEFQVKLLAENISKNNNLQITYLSRKTGRGYRPHEYDLIKISRENIFQRYGFFFDSINLLKLLNKIKPDIIYQRIGCAYTGITAFYAKKAGCKMIWHISSDKDLLYGYNWSNIKPNIFIDKTLFRWGIKNAQIIIAQSEFQKTIIERINPNASTHLIRNFHPLPAIKGISDKSDQVAWVSNIKKLKQPEIFFKLAEEIKKKEIKTQFILVGAPAAYPKDYQMSLEKHLKNLDNVQYTGRLNLDKVDEIINQSKILINTSKWEGFPNTFIQAWMRKTPVVSLHCDPDHIIRNHKCGMVSLTFENMVENVLFLLNNEAKRIEMGENAQKYAFENHSMNNLNKLEKIILENL